MEANHSQRWGETKISHNKITTKTYLLKIVGSICDFKPAGVCFRVCVLPAKSLLTFSLHFFFFSNEISIVLFLFAFHCIFAYTYIYSIALPSSDRVCLIHSSEDEGNVQGIPDQYTSFEFRNCCFHICLACGSMHRLCIHTHTHEHICDMKRKMWNCFA